MRGLKFGCASVSLTVMLSACGQHQNIDVSEDWKASIRNYGLQPLYPMQEDIQIGDVFLYLPPENRTASANGDFTNSEQWLTRIGGPDRKTLIENLTTAYQDRLWLQPAPTTNIATTPTPPTAPAAITPAPASGVLVATLAAPTSPTSQSPTAPASAQASNQSVFCTLPPGSVTPGSALSPVSLYSPASCDVLQPGGSSQLRFRRVALPGLTVATVSDVKAGAAAPIDGILAKIGLSSADSRGYSITLNNIEEIHLPMPAAFSVMDDTRDDFLSRQLTPSTLLRLIHQSRPSLLGPTGAVCMTHFGDLSDKDGGLIIANEVVYAQSVSYSFSSSSTFAGNLGASLASGTAGAAANPPTPSPPSAATPINANSAATLPSASQSIAGANSSLTGALTALNASGGGALPNGDLSFGIGKTGDLTLTQTFPMPMAFGIGSYLTYSIGEVFDSYQYFLANEMSQDEAMSAADKEKYVAEAKYYITKYCETPSSPPSPLMKYLFPKPAPSASDPNTLTTTYYGPQSAAKPFTVRAGQKLP